MFFLHRLRSLSIVKVFSFTAISTLVKMLTGFISVKVVASLIGPAGIAMLGQLNNFSVIVLTLASAGINSGVTKYVSEVRDSDNGELGVYICTAAKIIVCTSLSVGILLICFARTLSVEVLHAPSYHFVFIIFGVTILFYGINLLLLAIVNGFRDFKKYVIISISDSVVGLLFSLSLVWFWGLKGALISAVTYQSIVLIATLFILRGTEWIQMLRVNVKFEKNIAVKYMKFSAMTFVTAATVPVSQMIVRGYAISHISMHDAGIWEAMNRLSNMYLMIFSTSFSVYYLPRLSEINDENQLRSEILNGYKMITPILFIFLSTVFVFREYIISLVFSNDFISMSELFLGQLVGDFFKIMSWILAFLMLAKAHMTKFILTEIIFSLLFVGLGFIFLANFKIVGLVYAYAINYFLYFLAMIFLFRRLLFNLKS